MAIEMDEYRKIRQYKEAGELSQRAVAEVLGISRNTVRRYWDGTNVPWERKEGSGRHHDVLTEEIEKFVRSCLEEDEKSHLKKQKHTARRIYNRLVTELGFEGGESSVRALVAHLRAEPRDSFVPLEYHPGEAFQIDWGEATVYLGSHKVKLNIWCMRECYSDDFYCCAFYRQNEESFLEGIRNGIEYFGGAPRKMIFDNARVAVKEGFGSCAKTTDRYLSMSAHYAFEPVFCNVASGHEKGLVEGLVGFIRRNTLVPAPRVNSIEEVNDLLLRVASDYRKHRVAGKEGAVGERAAVTQAHLIPLPPYRYDTAKTLRLKVDEFSLIRFDTNRYSVPYGYSARTVTVKGTGTKVTILCDGAELAVHERDYEHNHTHYRLEHYLRLLEKKPRSICNAAPVRQNVPEEFMRFLEKLNSPRALIGALRLYLQYGDTVVSHLKGITTYEALLTEMEREVLPSQPHSHTDFSVRVVLPKLDAYNTLLTRGGVN